MDEEQLQQERWEIFYGGVDLKVNLIDAEQKKVVEETVKVRKIPLRDLQSMASVWGKMSEEISFYAKKPAEWVDRLDDESALQILDEGRRLNSKSFAAWFKRQNQAAELMTGEKIDVAQRVGKAIDQAIQEKVQQSLPS